MDAKKQDCDGTSEAEVNQIGHEFLTIRAKVMKFDGFRKPFIDRYELGQMTRMKIRGRYPWSKKAMFLETAACFAKLGHLCPCHRSR